MTHLVIPKHARLVAKFPGDWTLYKKQDDGTHSFLWPQFRLMQPPNTKARWGETRTFNLAWNPLEQRFRKDAESLILERRYSGLAAMVELHMSLNYGPEWLTADDGAGVTPEEIQAERARLAELSRERKIRRRLAGKDIGAQHRSIRK